ncbi:MAG: Adenosylhomocysteinase [Firmicutes bacterium ADurb.Bin262]|nr:MAG: Adenosylhomocysteinase [Firmicutes bacterium ADurb.Bin262]
MNEIKDITLAPDGRKKIDWVRRNMPLLGALEREFTAEKPFAGLKIALSVHLEAKTAYLCEVLTAGGAEMYITGSNPLSTQDDVAAALAARGLNVFAVHDPPQGVYEQQLERVIAPGPNIIIDDGGDLVNLIHGKYASLLPGVSGGCEETTTGIMRLKAMEKAGELKFPMIAVNDARCKYLFDNRYGTGQSVWDGINRTTNLIVAGKTVVVAGYGWCGKGIALRAKGLGARVVITEIDAVKAVEAVMDGFEVMTMDDAAQKGDLFITATGCRDVISERHFPLLKDGAILCNAGHFDVEVDVAALEKICREKTADKPNIAGYTLENGRKIFVIAQGRLVNICAGDGHPAEIMDMSFAIQALSARYLAANAGTLKGGRLLNVPAEIDERVARMKLGFWGRSIDTLTKAQEEYLGGY